MNNLIEQINIKENELLSLKEQYNKEIEIEKSKVLKSKSEGLSKSIYLLGFNFNSSTGETEQFKEFYNIFKKEFKDILKEHIKEIEINKGHFELYGFFRLKDDRVFYISLSDVRFFNDKQILIRTAKDFKDYTGGTNNNINLDDKFKDSLFNFLKV